MGQINSAQVVNKHLTQLASGWRTGSTIYDKLFPTIRTDKLEFSYIEWDSDAFQLRNHLRGYSAPVRSDDYNYTKKSAAMPPGYSGSVYVDRRADRQTIGTPNLSLAAQKLKLKKREMELEKETHAANIVTDVANYAAGNHGNVTNAGTDGWNDPDTDIYGDVLGGLEVLGDTIGADGSDIVMLISRDVETAMRKNNSLKAFYNNTNPGAAAFDLTDLAKKIFGIKDIVVGKMNYKVNGTLTKVWGPELASLVYVSDEMGDGVFDPSDLPPSFGWHIQLDGVPFVEEDYIKERTSDAYYLHDNHLFLQTSNLAGYMFESVLT